MATNGNVLEIQDLTVSFRTDAGDVRAVDGMSLAIQRGRVTALVGESGCGKSVTGCSILRLVDKPGRIVGGTIRFVPAGGPPVDITALAPTARQLHDLRGGKIGMIFQDPTAALSPVHTIGNQICEAIRLHRSATRKQAREQAVALLDKVGMTILANRDSHSRLEQVSGGRSISMDAGRADPGRHSMHGARLRLGGHA